MSDRSERSTRVVPRPSPTEVLCNLLLGPDEGASVLPEPRGVPVRQVLEEAMLPSLQRSPCFVSFSGGRDSSAVLAVAVDVARRHGLPDPVPATMRFVDAPTADETSWQELVLEHLGISDHAVVDLHHELDALGEIATDVLDRFGVRWPGNAYMHVPLFERARGGSMLTGVGGDELFGTRASRFVLVAHGSERPVFRDALSLGFALTPRPLRAAIQRRRSSPAHPWLTRRGGALVDRALARDEVAWPSRWDGSIRHWYGTRAFTAVRHALPELAAAWDVSLVCPFVDPRVLAELAREGGPTGFASRDAAMERLFGDLLPPALLRRPHKATFGAPVWGPEVRSFAASWDGTGVDERHVDAPRMREEWLRPHPNFMTVLLLHTAWMESRRRDSATQHRN